MLCLCAHVAGHILCPHAHPRAVYEQAQVAPFLYLIFLTINVSFKIQSNTDINCFKKLCHLRNEVEHESCPSLITHMDNRAQTFLGVRLDAGFSGTLKVMLNRRGTSKCIPRATTA